MKTINHPHRNAYLLLIIAALIAFTPQVFAEVELKVMSYNVRYGTAQDGENAWPKRREMLVRSVEAYDPDIIGVQECLDFQAEYISKELNVYKWIGVGRERNGTGEMTAILYRHKELIPVESGHFWNSETPEEPGSKSWDTSLTRITSWVKFYNWREKQYFYHFNTHLDHQGKEARKESAHLIAKRIAALPENTPVFLTGDFNALGGKSAPWIAATEGGLKDSWDHAAKKVGPNNTWSGFTGPEESLDRRIDWILFRGPVTPLHCETVLFNEAGKYPSDHCAVFGKFSF